MLHQLLVLLAHLFDALLLLRLQLLDFGRRFGATALQLRALVGQLIVQIGDLRLQLLISSKDGTRVEKLKMRHSISYA